MKYREKSFCIVFAIALTFIMATTAIAQFVQQGDKLVGNDAVGAAMQGDSVSLSGDGNTAIVGGFHDNSGAGAAWVFTRANGVWSQQGYKLVGTGAVGPLPSTQGFSVSLSGDGNTAIVGGIGNDNNIGAAWVFRRTNGVWSQQGNKLVGTDAIGPCVQGNSVSLSGDGNTAIVGGPNDNNGVGAAWVYTRAADGWTQEEKLVADGHCQGWSVSLSRDGNTALVGVPCGNNDVGAAWIFARGASGWTQETKLVGEGGVGGASQGFSVSLSMDGNTAILGAPGDNNHAGAAWVFTRTNGVWSQQKLVGIGGAGTTQQGFSVSLSGDGNTAIVGGGGSYGFPEAGAAWVFMRTNGVWIEQGNKLVSTGAVGLARQGLSVSLSADGNTAIVGGPGDNSDAGAAWVYFSLNTSADSKVVKPIDPNTGTTPVTVTFDNVTTPGTTSVTTTSTGTPPPFGFKLGDPPVYYTIETTAGCSGPIQICINYGGISYGSEKDIKLFHWSSTANSWQDVTDKGYPDMVNDVICGTVTSLSLLGVFEPSYSFAGFLPPLENPPVTNAAKAGQAIPVKWQLMDSGGFYISDLGTVSSITFQQIQCSDVSAGLTSEVPATETGSSGLRYDTAANQFVYSWKSEKSMAGNCYLLTLTLYGFSKYKAFLELK